jgi:hypothetical protein
MSKKKGLSGRAKEHQPRSLGHSRLELAFVLKMNEYPVSNNAGNPKVKSPLQVRMCFLVRENTPGDTRVNLQG